MLTEQEKQAIRNKLLSDGYGITPTGCNIKRLDVLLNEVNAELSEKLQFGTNYNKKSFLSVITTAYVNKIAELWEFGQMVYDSFNPATAEGLSIDNLLLLGGSQRENALPTVYPVHVQVVENNYPNGTILPSTTQIKSNTNPAVTLTINRETVLSRRYCNIAKIKVATLQQNAVYTVSINGTSYSYTTGQMPNIASVYAGLTSAINADENAIVTAENSASGNFFMLHDKNNDANFTSGDRVEVTALNSEPTSFELTLSENLTTDSIFSIVNFNTDETGDIFLPNNTINQIVTELPNFLSVNNIVPRTEGQDIENDVQARKSYLDKIFNRASRMTEAIRSRILSEVVQVSWCSVKENDTDVTDADGRPPHSIEVIAESPQLSPEIDNQIAQIIFDTKSAGIQTYGDIDVVITLENGEQYTVHFNRPTDVILAFNCTVTKISNKTLPSNYVSIIQNIILLAMDDIQPEQTVVPAQIVKDVYAVLPNIASVNVVMSIDGDEVDIFTPTARQFAKTTAENIVVNEV